MLGVFSFSPGAPEVLMIVAVVLLLFGAKKIPEMARSLGRSSSEFKRGLRDDAADADVVTTALPEAAEPEDSADPDNPDSELPDSRARRRRARRVRRRDREA